MRSPGTVGFAGWQLRCSGLRGLVRSPGRSLLGGWFFRLATPRQPCRFRDLAWGGCDLVLAVYNGTCGAVRVWLPLPSMPTSLTSSAANTAYGTSAESETIAGLTMIAAWATG